MAKGGRREVSGGRRQPDRCGSVDEDHHGGLLLTPTHPDDRSFTSEKPGKKKRHTAHQTQQMEAVFLECSHPNYMQRLKLSEELGLTPEQVLFWFQNRRTMMKVQKEREEKRALLEENERLRAENNRLKAAMRNMSCPSCGDPVRPRAGASPEVQRLRLENACLREQVARNKSHPTLDYFCTCYGDRGYAGLPPFLISSSRRCKRVQVERWSRAVAMYGILLAQPINRRRYAEPPPAAYSRADVIDVPATSPPGFEKVGTPDELSG